MADFSDLVVLSVDELEENLGSAKFKHFVDASESFFADQVEAIADYVLAHEQVRAVFVSGPTSSGKTTSARILSRRLQAAGRNAMPLELDDYYLPQHLRYDAEGRPDFESIDTIDLPLLGEHLARLFGDEEVGIPTFLFGERTRIYEEHKRIRLQENDIAIVEGLHGLNRTVMEHVPEAARVTFFIMPHARMLDDSRMLSGSDIRILRRISRDVNHRGASALDTVDYWPMIERAERDFIPAYLEAAQFYVNSILPYEFAVVAPLARKHLEISLAKFYEGTLEPSTYTINERGHSNLELAVKEAQRLVTAAQKLPAVSREIVPENSILKEFI